MVEDRIYNWINENYGEIEPSLKRKIANTFELYWDQFIPLLFVSKTLKKNTKHNERINLNPIGAKSSKESV